ncbi:hypothetical protein LVB87_11150 [Lysobacter sp. KIS68-7]|uniref:hypothetical protein n=1 Tax=Lysobacter sp. KIS68-7 TaxID=2904252 RepID=UPI001E46DC17|nr:hypothetical protein [Lysobacter sp. KIS68-7]UHQ18741.1 hypothetical protein LVB87_11150 [Lysobacter sp. KIS68-7]
MRKREGGGQEPNDKRTQRRDSKGRFSYGDKHASASEESHEQEPEGQPPGAEREDGEMKH